MRYWPTTALYAITAAEAAISPLSPPPPPPPSYTADDVPGSSCARNADTVRQAVTPSGATILIVVLSMVISVIALHFAIRCFLSNGDEGAAEESRGIWERKKAAELREVVAAVSSTVKYKAGGGEEGEAAVAAECAICLAELEEGEEMKVLGNCGHGFHGGCIERWFATSRNSSCPTCRRSCLPPTLSPVVVAFAIATDGGG